jgi:uncharacterized glyoxalase superfamily protein PhnB
MPWLSRIAPELPVTDLKGAIKYYGEILGFRLVADFRAGAYAIVERDDVAIHLFEDAARRPSPVGIHIFTNGLHELQAELLSRGAQLSQTIIVKPWGNRDLRVNDPFGNELKFTEPVPELEGNR